MQETTEKPQQQSAEDTARLQAGKLSEFLGSLGRHLQAAHGFSCVDHELPARAVHSEEACLAWCEATAAGSKPKRQMFGTFIDVDAAPYLLHVEVATTNLHVGVVRVQRQRDGLAVVAMSEFDTVRIEARLNRRLPPHAQLVRRSWGHVWCSVDCGDFRKFHAAGTFEKLVAADGPLMTDVIAPLAKAMHGFVRERAWAWQAFDRRQWWRFFVDGRFQRKYAGWRGYEDNEPRSVQGMLDAFAYIIENFDRAADLDIPYLVELHRRIMQGVRTQNPKSTPGEFRFRETGFHFYAKTTTLASLAEVFELRRGDGSLMFFGAGYARTTEELDYLEAYEAIQKNEKLRYRAWYPVLSKEDQAIVESVDGSPRFLALKTMIQDGLRAQMQASLDAYYKQMAAARRDSDRIWAIGKLVRDLELIHPFPDGNGRAFPVALACQLLMYHGFPPPIFRDPNIDAELSYAEFAAEIVKSMRDTLALIRDPEMTLHGYAIGESSQQEIDDFAAMARELSARVDMLDRERGADEIYTTADHAAWATGGRWINYRQDLRFTNTGSHRTYRKGALYFAWAEPDWEKEGKSVDQELRQVIGKGARALVLNHPVEPDRYPVPVLVVKDYAAAVRALAHRTRKDVGCRTVLVTGTEGKTGAKVQLHHLLRRQTEVHAVINSANTEGPVMFSLANLRASTKVEINEVSVGAIEAMRVERARLVSPDLCLFTNIGPNHMDMHKTIENIIIAKSSVVVGLPAGAPAILNADNEYFPQLREAIKQRRPDVAIRSYGSGPDNTARLRAASFDGDRLGWQVRADIAGDKVDYFVPLLQNYAPLASVGILLTVKMLGCDVARAARDYADLEPYATMGRMLKLHLDGGDVLFYDQSRRGGMHGMRSAFKDLGQISVPGRVIGLVGGISINRDGDWTRQAHGELAQLINASGIDRLYTTGNFMNYVHEKLERPEQLVKHSDDIEELAAALRQEIRPGDLLFMIGSAYLYLGRVSDLLLERLPHSVFHAREEETAQ